LFYTILDCKDFTIFHLGGWLRSPGAAGWRTGWLPILTFEKMLFELEDFCAEPASYNEAFSDGSGANGDYTAVEEIRGLGAVQCSAVQFSAVQCSAVDR
jgi:hypothetical protein